MSRAGKVLVGVLFAAMLALGAGLAVAATTAGNRRAARADARVLVARLRLPRGAVRVRRRTGGSFPLYADQAHALAHASWRVPGRPGTVIAYIRSHPPAGAKLFSTGWSGSSRARARELTLGYQWPPRRGVLGERLLNVIVTAQRGGASSVLAVAQSDWVVVRSASERVPASARIVQITTSSPRRTVTLTAAPRVRRLIALVDSLPIAQPVTINCPALIDADARQVSFSFRARASGPVLARADYVGYEPHPYVSGPCNAIAFSVRGRPRTPLIGGADFLHDAQRIAGTVLIGH